MLEKRRRGGHRQVPYSEEVKSNASQVCVVGAGAAGLYAALAAARLGALVAQDERADVLEGRRVTAVLSAGDRATGVRLADGTSIASAAVIVATGGAAALWARTTNPAGATGGGLLLAHRAGAALADLEM